MRNEPPGSVLRIGTRGSALALAQSREIQRKLKKKFPRISFPLIVIKTRGDEFQSVELFKKKNVGVFTKAIEKALLKKEVDLAVHSLKDLPTDLPKALCLAAVPKRMDPKDVLVSRRRYTLKTLPRNATVGTGSPRRKRQLKLSRPDLNFVDIRGNLDTRIKKALHGGELDAVVVARAGLLRLKKYLGYASPLDPRTVLPAVGQAALGLEVRKADRFALRILKSLNDPKTEKMVGAERALLKSLSGGCRVPVGVHTELRKKRLRIRAAVFSVRTEAAVTGQIEGPILRSETLARVLAKKMLKKGAGKLMKEARE